MDQAVQFDHFSNFLNIAKRKSMKNEQEIWEALKALKKGHEEENDKESKAELYGAIVAIKWVLEKLFCGRIKFIEGGVMPETGNYIIEARCINLNTQKKVIHTYPFEGKPTEKALRKWRQHRNEDNQGNRNFSDYSNCCIKDRLSGDIVVSYEPPMFEVIEDASADEDFKKNKKRAYRERMGEI